MPRKQYLAFASYRGLLYSRAVYVTPSSILHEANGPHRCCDLWLIIACCARSRAYCVQMNVDWTSILEVRKRRLSFSTFSTEHPVPTERLDKVDFIESLVSLVRCSAEIVQALKWQLYRRIWRAKSHSSGILKLYMNKDFTMPREGKKNRERRVSVPWNPWPRPDRPAFCG